MLRLIAPMVIGKDAVAIRADQARQEQSMQSVIALTAIGKQGDAIFVISFSLRETTCRK